MKSVGLIGYYSLNQELVNGQTIKSKLVRDVLIEALGKAEVSVCDYSNWKKHLFRFGCELISMFVSCRNIIAFPAKHAINYIIPTMCKLKIIFRTRIHYYVVGGWLMELLKEKPGLIMYLKQLDGIYVELEKMKTELNNLGLINTDFIGFIEYERMAAFLDKSDITVNAIKRNGSQSIINKIADYFAAGKPMLNGCISKEMISLVERYQVGLNYIPENVDSLVNSIQQLLSHPELCKTYGENAQELSRLKFDRENSYLEILGLIDTMKRSS